MTDAFDVRRREFAARAADLAFSIELPADWVAHDLPASDDDYSDPTLFLPLAVVTARSAAMVFAIGARPAFDDGSVHDWTMYLIDQSPVRPRALGAGEAGSLPAIVGEGAQDSEIGEMIVRFAFVEDGGRLLHLSMSAPTQLDSIAARLWFTALQSFTLDRPRGATTPLFAPVEAPAEVPDEEEHATASPSTFVEFALAETTESLDPDESMNARLRENGTGFTARLLEADREARRARVAASGLMASFDVPYGWHVLDDGRRALVFERRGEVQINLDLVTRDGRDAEAILAEIRTQALADYPGAETARASEGAMEALAIRGVEIEGEALEQIHILIAGADDTKMLRARVTAPPERSRDAANLAELILASARFFRDVPADVPNDPPGDGPPWWRRAKALERAGRLTEAEETITSSVQHLGALASVARLYADRMTRLAHEGDNAGAAEAHEQARRWITSYAAGATSGGEGAALSRERDAFLASLGDPPEVS